jgi:hypothetical protein
MGRLSHIVLRYRDPISLEDLAMASMRTFHPAETADADHCAVHDVREEPVGAFAGTLAPDAPVGTYGNVRRLRRQGAGTFAGDPDRQRQGSFADGELTAA